MHFAKAYLDKVSLDPQIDGQLPSPDLRLVIAIPASDEPDIMKTLHALRECFTPEGDVELILVLNSAESAPDEVIVQNLVTEKEIHGFINDYTDQKFRVLCTNRPGIRDKEAGAGFARKMAMDHALSRFNKLDRPDGIIISMDADTLCDPNYLFEVEKHFRSNPLSKACSVYFEHPLGGSDFPDRVYLGITEYELHMRYYIEALRFAGHPHAYHTVGSAFCVRAGIYASQGGMNKRPAGEDFYFLQKVIPLGNYHELNSSCIIPSPRPSRRVAFGTGPVVSKFLSGQIESLESYDPNAFHDLREFFSGIHLLYSGSMSEIKALYDSWPESIRIDLEKEFFSRLVEIRGNSAREETFYKRFFRWFNMFRTLKYLNFIHQEYYSRIPVKEAVDQFLKNQGKGTKTGSDAKDLLIYFRKIQQVSRWPD